MVNTLQFDMSVPTPYVFMRRFLKVAESEKKVPINNYIQHVLLGCARRCLIQQYF